MPNILMLDNNDFSMCSNNDCPSKRVCCRHQASGSKPSQHQSYAYFECDKMTGKCFSFIPKTFTTFDPLC